MAIFELRTYQIQPGKMEDWLTVFQRDLVPLHQRFGPRVLGWWRTEGEENEFVWLRAFPDMEQRTAMRSALYGSDEWRAVMPRVREALASPSEKLLLPGLPELAIEKERGAKGFVCELRTYQMAPGRTEEWLSLFQAETLPLHEQFDIRILGAWRADGEANEVVWMRGYPVGADREAMSQRLAESGEWQAHLGRIRGLSTGRASKFLIPA